MWTSHEERGQVDISGVQWIHPGDLRMWGIKETEKPELPLSFKIWCYWLMIPKTRMGKSVRRAGQMWVSVCLGVVSSVWDFYETSRKMILSCRVRINLLVKLDIKSRGDACTASNGGLHFLRILSLGNPCSLLQGEEPPLSSKVVSKPDLCSEERHYLCPPRLFDV